jgi:hypothetical protein
MKKTLLVLLALVATPSLAQTPPSEESLRQLFAAIHANTLMDSYMTQLDSGMQAGMRAALKGKTPNVKQQQIMDDMRARMIGVFKESFSWEKIEPMMTDI